MAAAMWTADETFIFLFNPDSLSSVLLRVPFLADKKYSFEYKDLILSLIWPVYLTKYLSFVN